jgi:hypothetical protein
MKATGLASLTALLILAAGPARAQSQQPIELAQLPYMEIFSPTFFWSDEADAVRTGSTTCPKGRAITGGVNIVQGKAALRIVESYPDGESWVTRVVNRDKPETVTSLQVRTYALCLLPSARKASKLVAQLPRISYTSVPFNLPAGFVSTPGRSTCQPGALVLGGGFGLDQEYRGPSNLRLELSYPDPNGWNVRAVNGAAASGPAAGARIYTICLSNKDGMDIRNYKTVYFAEAEAVVKADNGTVRQSVKCEPDSYIVSGGMRSIRGRSASLELGESFPDSPSSWTVAVNNRGSKRDGDVTVRIYAVCLKK